MPLRVTHLLLFAALVLSTVALAFAWSNRTLSPGPSRIDMTDLEAQASAFRAELDQLNAQIAASEARGSTRRPAAGAGPDADLRCAELLERLARLEAELDAKLMAMAPPVVPSEEPATPTLGDTPADIEAMRSFQAAFLDVDLDLRARLNALGLLTRFPDEMAPLDAIVPEVRNLMSTLEGRDLERLVNTVDGVADERLRDALLELLSRTNDEEIRFEVVRALRPFLADASVRFALQSVAEGPDGVRSVEAARAALQLVETEGPGD